MPILLQFRSYALPFRAPVRTAHGIWRVREGAIVRLEDSATGRVGWGEAAPVPGFGTETAAADRTWLESLGGTLAPDVWARAPAMPPCVRHALATASAGLAGAASPALAAHLPVAALLPAGREALTAVRPRIEAGFRTFKWKVGVADPDDELALLDDLCAGLPEGARLRLDANGAWDRRTAECWLQCAAERPVEFVEQPIFAGAGADAAGRRRERDGLLGLAADYPTPIALDESLADDDDVQQWLEAGWRGVFVLKPSLLGAASETMSRLRKAGSAVVFSSALETAVGTRAALLAAFAWADHPAGAAARPAALGFGVTPLFADARCDGPRTAPFIFREDIERLDPETVWNALS